MRKSFTTIALAAIGSLALVGSASATEDWSTHTVQQQSINKVLSATGGNVKKGAPIILDSYLSTRDPASSKAASQPQAVATVRIKFPKNSAVNSIGKCPLWPTDKPWDFKRICGSSTVGEGWALVSGLGTSALGHLDVASGRTVAPTGSGNYNDAPADCNPTATRPARPPKTNGDSDPGDPGYSGSVDPAQYSRTYEAGLQWNHPMAGLSCTPLGFTWVHISSYAGNGNGYIDKTTGGVYDKLDAGKAPLTKSDGTMFVKGDVYPATITAGTLGSKHLVAGGTITTAQASAIKTAYGKLLKDKTAIDFANDNGVAALSFAGTISKNSDKTLTLAVDLPAFNDAGLKGFLPLDADLVDFRLVTNNTAYLKAGDCTAGKYHIISTFTYSPFPKDYATNTTHYADKVVDYQGTCSN